MEYRQFGQTNLDVSTLSLGTAALGMAYGITADIDKSRGLLPPPESEIMTLLHQALDAGITCIDTARAYGKSEALIGQTLRTERHRFILVTKVHCLDRHGSPLCGSALRSRIWASVSASLDALRTRYIDVLLIHSAPPQLLQRQEVLSALQGIKSQGFARAIGASTYGVVAPRLAIESGMDVIQVAYNVFDRRVEDEILPLAYQRGVAVMARSVFLKGALTERGDDLPDHLHRLRDYSRRFRQIAADYEMSAPELALRFVLSRPEISTSLVGVRTTEELDEALQAAANGGLPPDILTDLDALRIDDEQLVNPSHWGIP